MTGNQMGNRQLSCLGQIPFRFLWAGPLAYAIWEFGMKGNVAIAAICHFFESYYSAVFRYSELRIFSHLGSPFP